ncbi:hypothetical protein [Pluralibacter gergoviae]
MSEKDYDYLHRIDMPEFEEWFQKVAELVEAGGKPLDISYKGLWVDLYADGLTPEQAILSKIA